MRLPTAFALLLAFASPLGALEPLNPPVPLAPPAAAGVTGRGGAHAGLRGTRAVPRLPLDGRHALPLAPRKARRRRWAPHARPRIGASRRRGRCRRGQGARVLRRLARRRLAPARRPCRRAPPEDGPGPVRAGLGAHRGARFSGAGMALFSPGHARGCRGRARPGGRVLPAGGVVCGLRPRKGEVPARRGAGPAEGRRGDRGTARQRPQERREIPEPEDRLRLHPGIRDRPERARPPRPGGRRAPRRPSGDAGRASARRRIISASSWASSPGPVRASAGTSSSSSSSPGASPTSRESPSSSWSAAPPREPRASSSGSASTS
jgi:hypothetical protein